MVLLVTTCSIRIRQRFLSNKLEIIAMQSLFWYVLKVVVLDHGDNPFLFYFGIYIKFTLSAITLSWNGEMITSHLMFELQLFYGKNINTCYTTKPLRHSKIQITYDTKLKGIENSGIISLTEVLIFTTANTFSQLNLVFIADGRYFAAKYFLGLIYRLGTRINLIFQTSIQTFIFNPISKIV